MKFKTSAAARLYRVGKQTNNLGLSHGTIVRQRVESQNYPHL